MCATASPFSDGSPSSLMFIDETSFAAGSKRGFRHDLRSHVRNHVVARKTGKSVRNKHGKAISQSKIAPLRELRGRTGTPKSPQSGVGSADSSLESSLANSPSADLFGILDLEKFERQEKGRAVMQIKKPLKELLLNSSPLEALGAGRVDPFLSYPVEKPTKYLHELMDHAVTYLLPGLVPNYSKSELQTVSQTWFSRGLKNSLLFNALVLAGSIHLDFLRWRKIYPNSPQILVHKLAVISKLKEALRDPEKASQDEVILAISILSSHETMNDDETEGVGRKNPFVSPLGAAQWLSVYGNIKYVPEHMIALLELVVRKGGLEKLELLGLAECLTVGDIISSTRAVSKPIFPPLAVCAGRIEHLFSWTEEACFPREFLCLGFQGVKYFGLTEDLIFVLQGMAASTVAQDHYIKRKPNGLILGAISKCRWAVQQRLLLLPSSSELSPIPRVKPHIYECCRLTAFIYGIAIIFPIPNSYKVLQELVTRVKEELEGLSEPLESCDLILKDFWIWVLVLGAIAALDKAERGWYIEKLRVVAVTEGKLFRWEEVTAIMDSFLWMESACSPSGRLMWDEVENVRKKV